MSVLLEQSETSTWRMKGYAEFLCLVTCIAALEIDSQNHLSAKKENFLIASVKLGDTFSLICFYSDHFWHLE